MKKNIFLFPCLSLSFSSILSVWYPLFMIMCKDGRTIKCAVHTWIYFILYKETFYPAEKTCNVILYYIIYFKTITSCTRTRVRYTVVKKFSPVLPTILDSSRLSLDVSLAPLTLMYMETNFFQPS